MAHTRTGRKASRGNFETLRSGAVRVRVYAGVDPLTGRPHYLKETVPDGPDVMVEAEKVRTRLLNQVDEGRNPRTKATVNQLMDRYLELLDVEVTTRKSYEGRIRVHIRPLLGALPLGKLTGERLDKFYSVLRACHAHCGGRSFVEHRTEKDHECDGRCHPHECSPLSPSMIRQVHSCLSGALGQALRWHWITVNPMDQAKPPKTVRPEPNPPSSTQAATIVHEAFKDLEWGALIWVAMTTGARRGELCALRWNLVDLNTGLLTIRASIAQDGTKVWEKGTKNNQQRRISLDTETAAMMRAYRTWCESQIEAVGGKLAPDSYVFSSAIDHLQPLKPDSVTQRYSRMCRKLGWKMHLHQLRHYSATELIASGADIRTVAGRLGHGGGGATTLRVYTAWVSEADQRAAGNLSARMPALPIAISDSGKPVVTRERDAENPYQIIAKDLRGAIVSGVLSVGDLLPPEIELANRYQVAASTAHRAINELKTVGLVKATRGRRAVVVSQTESTNDMAKVVNLRDHG